MRTCGPDVGCTGGRAADAANPWGLASVQPHPLFAPFAHENLTTPAQWPRVIFGSGIYLTPIRNGKRNTSRQSTPITMSRPAECACDMRRNPVGGSPRSRLSFACSSLQKTQGPPPKDIYIPVCQPLVLQALRPACYSCGHDSRRYRGSDPASGRLCDPRLA
jgi:hypothetical protein